MADLKHMIEQLGGQAKIFFIKNLATALDKTLCIIHLKSQHYVCIQKIKADYFKLYDPLTGIRFVNAEALSQFASGFMLSLTQVKTISDKKFQTNPLGQYGLTKFWKRFTLILMLTIFSQAIILSWPVFITKFYDLNFQSIALPFFAILMIKLTGAGLEFIKAKHILKAGQHYKSVIVKSLTQKLSKFNYAWFMHKDSHKLFMTIAKVHKLSALYHDNILTTFMNAGIALLMSVVVCYFLPKLFLITALAIIIILIYHQHIYQRLYYLVELSLQQKISTDNLLLQNLQTMLTIKANHVSTLRHDMWLSKHEAHSQIQHKIAAAKARFQFVRESILAFETLAIIVCAQSLIGRHLMSYGVVFLIIINKNYLQITFKSLLDKYFDFVFIRNETAALGCILDEDLPQSSAMIVNVPLQAIQAHNITFTYPNAPHPIIQNLNFKLPLACDLKRHESLLSNACILGQSGAGKTTLLYLLLGILKPTSGFFTGHASSEAINLSSDDYGAMIASVLQNDKFFSGTLKENLTFFQPDIDECRLVEVCKLACIYDFIQTLPLGFDTFIDDHISKISGGQKQRLLIARALYKKPKILFLDEATNQLDPITEKKVLDNLFKLPMSKIIISHQQNLIARCDTVIQL